MGASLGILLEQLCSRFLAFLGGAFSIWEAIAMDRYTWWGMSNPPPDHLKTKRQILELGLTPKDPIAFIPNRRSQVLLYDPDRCPPKRQKSPPTPAQLEALRLGRLKQQWRADCRRRRQINHSAKYPPERDRPSVPVLTWEEYLEWEQRG